MTSLFSLNPREDNVGSNRLQKFNRSENANLGRMDFVRTRNEIAPEAKRRPRLSTDFEGVTSTRGRSDPIAFEDFRAEEFKAFGGHELHSRRRGGLRFNRQSGHEAC